MTIPSGVTAHPQQEEFIEAARRLDLWGRPLLDWVNTLQELNALGVRFVFLCEALDLAPLSG